MKSPRLSLWCALVAVACSAAAPSKPKTPAPCTPIVASSQPATQPKSALRPAPKPDPLVDELNLSFERGDPKHPDHWELNGAGYSLSAETEAAHSGQRGLYLRAPTQPAAGAFGVAGASLPIERARGRRVRLSGWIRTRAVGGYAGLWLRVDGPNREVVSLDNMHDTGPRGTTDWRRYEIELDVPTESSHVVFGALLVGTGEAWVDDLDVGFDLLDPKEAVNVHGVVLTADGKLVPGALVAALRRHASRPVQVVETGRDGRFSLSLPQADWAFSATAASGVAGFRQPHRLSSTRTETLRLGRIGFTVNGEVRTKAGARLPEDARLVLARYSNVEGDLFVVPLGADGKFTARLPPGQGYSASVWSKGVLSEPKNFSMSRDQYLLVDATVISAPPDAVVDWVRGAAVRLSSPEAGHGLDDLAPLADTVRGARIVALGEATHGTREFFQMKHRLLEYLVEKQGFTVFAIEANLPEARKVNDYVLHGTGDPAKALAGLYFWTWNTEEVLAMIRWMRTYNLDPKHAHKVQFMGFDMQTTSVAWPNVVAYLQKVDPTYAATLPAKMSGFADSSIGMTWRSLVADDRKVMRDGADAVVARLDAQRSAYTARSSAKDWRFAREDARVVAQAANMFEGGNGGSPVRDAAMAENVDYILSEEAKGEKVVLWAHNGHIADSPGWMGHHLRVAHGAEYRNIGFVFAEGSFQAIDQTGHGQGLHEFTLGPAPDTDVSTAFTRAGCELCILDLHRAPEGPIGEWFRIQHPMRETGAVFRNEEDMTVPARLADLFDAVVFVRTTTRARPNPRQ